MKSTGKDVTRDPKALVCWFLLTASLLWGAASQATEVVIVTDLRGGAAFLNEGSAREIVPLAGIAPGFLVLLDTGATLTALYKASGDEYAFTGPARVEFGPRQPEVLAGAIPMRRRLAPLPSIRVKDTRIVQATLPLRGMRARPASFDGPVQESAPAEQAAGVAHVVQ